MLCTGDLRTPKGLQIEDLHEEELCNTEDCVQEKDGRGKQENVTPYCKAYANITPRG